METSPSQASFCILKGPAETTRKPLGILGKHPKMIENARSVQQVKNALKDEVTPQLKT